MSLLRRSIPLEDRIELDRLLDDAFAPGRSRTATLSPARVRARVAWEREAPASRGWRAVALLGRLGEGSLALGLTAILLAGSVGGVGGVTESLEPEPVGGSVSIVRAPLDEPGFLRLLRLGAPVPGPDLGRASAIRLVGDQATSVFTVRDREAGGDVGPGPAGPAGDGGDERQGLIR